MGVENIQGRESWNRLSYNNVWSEGHNFACCVWMENGVLHILIILENNLPAADSSEVDHQFDSPSRRDYKI